jgi:hypothetical protein
MIFRKLSRKFKFHYNLRRITRSLHQGLCKFMITSRSVLPVMRNVSDTRCTKNRNKHIFSNLFPKSCRLWDNVGKCGKVGQDTHGNTTQKICDLHAGQQRKESRHIQNIKYLPLYRRNNANAKAPKRYVTVHGTCIWNSCILQMRTKYYSLVKYLITFLHNLYTKIPVSTINIIRR